MTQSKTGRNKQIGTETGEATVCRRSLDSNYLVTYYMCQDFLDRQYNRTNSK